MIFQLDLSDALNPILSLEDNIEDIPLPAKTYYSPVMAIPTPLNADQAYLKIVQDSGKTLRDAWRHSQATLQQQGYTAHTWATYILNRVYQLLLRVQTQQNPQHEDHHE